MPLDADIQEMVEQRLIDKNQPLFKEEVPENAVKIALFDLRCGWDYSVPSEEYVLVFSTLMKSFQKRDTSRHVASKIYRDGLGEVYAKPHIYDARNPDDGVKAALSDLGYPRHTYVKPKSFATTFTLMIERLIESKGKAK